MTNPVVRELVDLVDDADRPLSTGIRGHRAPDGLLHRIAATVVDDGHGRVLVYRRPAHARILPGHHDVLVGGSVRAGESYLDAAVRELAEEFAVAADPYEVWRERHDSPDGPCWLAVHHGRLPAGARLTPLAGEVAWHALIPLTDLLTRPPQPFNPTGLAVLERIAGRVSAAAPTRDRPGPHRRNT
ncbi:NUDIX domain-containing protein [Streptomyces niveiscabiei]|uniref:NUDIX domain-containing protein n=1 Tax=Streptomyces niveiscabiei TaxID=164115 RepID=A0ABW9I7V1_9ACTN